jgi:hypothetical protein
MHIRIVTFGLDGISVADYEQQASSVAAAFTEWPGLQAKWWLADHESGTFGGVYVFDDEDAADASRGTALFAAMTANPAFTRLTVREFETLAGPTAITAPMLTVATA